MTPSISKHRAAHLERGINEHDVVAIFVVLWPLEGNVVKVGQTLVRYLLDGVLDLEPAPGGVRLACGIKGIARQQSPEHATWGQEGAHHAQPQAKPSWADHHHKHSNGATWQSGRQAGRQP